MNNNQLKQRVSELEEKLEHLKRVRESELKVLDVTARQLKSWQHKKHASFLDEECWLFMDDGNDKLENLVCPVVMKKSKAIELVNAREERDQLAAYVDGLRIDIDIIRQIAAHPPKDKQILKISETALAKKIQYSLSEFKKRQAQESFIAGIDWWLENCNTDNSLVYSWKQEAAKKHAEKIFDDKDCY